MDRLSGALIGAICFLMCLSAAVVYITWVREEPGLPASSMEEIEEEMSLAAIAMNTQSQVINGGGRDMWIRAEIQMPEAGNASAETAGGASCRLVSDTIAENPGPREREQGVWVPAEDGYYYYSIPVHPGEQSRPLFQSIETSGAVKTRGENEASGIARRGAQKGPSPARSVKVRAEGIQVNWVSGAAKTCQEAYRLFELYRPVWDDGAAFV